MVTPWGIRRQTIDSEPRCWKALTRKRASPGTLKPKSSSPSRRSSSRREASWRISATAASVSAGVTGVGLRDRLQFAVDADHRRRADLQVQVGAAAVRRGTRAPDWMSRLIRARSSRRRENRETRRRASCCRQAPVEGTVTLSSDRSKKPIGSPSFRSHRPTGETCRRAAFTHRRRLGDLGADAAHRQHERAIVPGRAHVEHGDALAGRDHDAARSRRGSDGRTRPAERAPADRADLDTGAQREHRGAAVIGHAHVHHLRRALARAAASGGRCCGGRRRCPGAPMRRSTE